MVEQILEGDFMSVISMHPTFPRKVYEKAEAIAVMFGADKCDCAWFRRFRECTMTVGFKGNPCNDYTCSACGKMHCAPQLHAYCPRCGAKIAGESEG